MHVCFGPCARRVFILEGEYYFVQSENTGSMHYALVSVQAGCLYRVSITLSRVKTTTASMHIRYGLQEGVLYDPN